MHHPTSCGYQNGADEIVALSRFTDNRPGHVPFHRDTLLDVEHDLEDCIIDSLSQPLAGIPQGCPSRMAPVASIFAPR
jgi:hypothetical protein